MANRGGRARGGTTPQRHERDVEDDECKLAVRRDQAGEESGGWEGLPEAADVFLDRVRGLSDYESGEGLGAGHVAEMRSLSHSLARG